jgi:hypothetical protein
MRAACAAASPAQPFTRRYASDASVDPPINTEPLASSSEPVADTESASAPTDSESYALFLHNEPQL